LDALFVSLWVIVLVTEQNIEKKVKLAESLAKLDVISALVVKVYGIGCQAYGCCEGSNGQIRPTAHGRVGTKQHEQVTIWPDYISSSHLDARPWPRVFLT
jgi:uncharacterized protein (DUF779 family)